MHVEPFSVCLIVDSPFQIGGGRFLLQPIRCIIEFVKGEVLYVWSIWFNIYAWPIPIKRVPYVQVLSTAIACPWILLFFVPPFLCFTLYFWCSRHGVQIRGYYPCPRYYSHRVWTTLFIHSIVSYLLVPYCTRASH